MQLLGRVKVAYKVLVGNPERQLGRHKRRWKNSIKIYLRVKDQEDVDSIYVAEERDQLRELGMVNVVTNSQFLRG